MVRDFFFLLKGTLETVLTSLARFALCALLLIWLMFLDDIWTFNESAWPLLVYQIKFETRQSIM